MCAALSLLTAELCGDIFCCCLAGWLSYPSLAPCRAFNSPESRALLANGFQEQRSIYSSQNKWVVPFWSPWTKPRSIQSDSEAASAVFAACTILPCLLQMDGAAAPGCDLWATKGTSMEKGHLTHRCFLSSSTAHTSPNHVLNHGRVLPEDRGDIQEQPSSENPLTHA